MNPALRQYVKNIAWTTALGGLGGSIKDDSTLARGAVMGAMVGAAAPGIHFAYKKLRALTPAVALEKAVSNVVANRLSGEWKKLGPVAGNLAAGMAVGAPVGYAASKGLNAAQTALMGEYPKKEAALSELSHAHGRKLITNLLLGGALGAGAGYGANRAFGNPTDQSKHIGTGALLGAAGLGGAYGYKALARTFENLERNAKTKQNIVDRLRKIEENKPFKGVGK